MSMHLLQRIYGTLVQAAPNPLAARAMVDQAEATLGETDRCSFCLVTLAVPSAIACARAGDLAEARRQLALAESSVARWKDTAWDAAVVEARAHIVAASGDLDACPRAARAGSRAVRGSRSRARGEALS